MRIIAGSAKKMLLKVPKNWNGRPTADRVKESVFNILGELIMDKVFVDVFSGTGNIGIEALSRGAKKCIFIEKNNLAFEAIKENLAKARFSSYAKIIKEDVFKALKLLESQKEKADVVFIDPPYSLGISLAVLERLAIGSILQKEAVLMVETSKRENLPEKVGNIILKRLEKYGDTLVWFYGYKSEGS